MYKVSGTCMYKVVLVILNIELDFVYVRFAEKKRVAYCTSTVYSKLI